jgi:hypothetical protein
MKITHEHRNLGGTRAKFTLKSHKSDYKGLLPE